MLTGVLYSLSFSLSFSVCVFRMVEYSLDLQNINLSAIRTVRVLRPLKAINRVPSKNSWSLFVHLCMCSFVCLCLQFLFVFMCVCQPIKNTSTSSWKFMSMYYISGFFVHLHATCSPWGSLNIHLMLNQTARSDPESQLYQIYKTSINAASLNSTWP